MKTGLQADLENTEITLYIDAVIKNLTSHWVDSLVDTVIEGHHDMARGTYLLASRDAGVTKLAAKPFLRVFFPEIAHYDNP